jgi:hypothetical protein
MNEKEYWELVDADPREWSRDQKVLFWWVVMLLPQVSKGIVTPDPSPLTTSQIQEVFEAILPQAENDTHAGSRAFMDRIWNYEGQLVLTGSTDGDSVSITNGNITVSKLEA